MKTLKIFFKLFVIFLRTNKNDIISGLKEEGK